jgi:AcrR family transcriptional regulator
MVGTPRTLDAQPPRRAPASSDRADQTRRRILDAAAVIFAERGYLGTSMNDLIGASGLAKGGFYFHFPSKESLAIACMQDKQEQWVDKVMSAALAHERAIDQLASIPRTLCDIYEQDPSFQCIGKLSVDLMDRRPELAPQIRPILGGWVQMTGSLIRRAQDEGDVRRDIDPDEAAEFAVAVVVGAQDMAQCLSAGADFRRRIESFVPLLLGAIASR